MQRHRLILLSISTHTSLAGRDRTPIQITKTHTISTHTSLAGRDYCRRAISFTAFISTHTSLAGRDRYILYKQAVTHNISRDGQFLHPYYIHLKQTFPLLFRRTSRPFTHHLPFALLNNNNSFRIVSFLGSHMFNSFFPIIPQIIKSQTVLLRIN